MKNNFTTRQITVMIAALIVRFGIICNAKHLIDSALWQHKQNGRSLLRVFTNLFGNFFGEWLIPLYFRKPIPALALIFLFVMLIYRTIHRSSLKRHSDPESAVRAEKKTSKLLFKLSFLPFVLFIIYCFISMFTGAEAGIITTYTVYGTEAFINTFIWWGLALCMFPVFPLMLIYQIVYIIRNAANKKLAAGKKV